MKASLKRNLLLLALSSFAVLPWAASQTVESAPISSSIAAASAPTPVPPLVPYAGVAFDAQSRPLTSSASISFLIFKEETGGEPLFAETQAVATDPTGHYKVQLGATLPNGLPQDLFSTGEARWLEVEVAGEAPQPRVLLVSVPYALKAGDATTLGGLPVSAFALAGSTNAIAASAVNGAHPDVISNVTTTGGTAGYVPEFNGSATIINSPIFVLGSDVGIGTPTPTAPLTVTGNSVLNGALTVNGDSTFNGPFVLPPPATATASKAYNSQFIKIEGSAWNSSTSSVVNPRFQWVGEIAGNNTATPTITLNLISSTTTADPTETGFHFNANGTMQFAPSQTFPGADITGTVNASGYNLGGSSFATGSSSAGNAYLGFSGNASSTGIENTATGYHALAADTSGNNNTATGYEVLFSNTTGAFNTGNGYKALDANTAGSNNTAVGHDALFNTTTGSSNTAVGYLAGPDSGSKALANSTALGANAVVSQSNSLVLGQTTVSSPGSTFVNVGIGTATPRSVLEASVGASGALGPSLTLTNTAGGLDAAASIDFNTYYHPATPYKNPTARIEAVDDNDYGNALYFQSKTSGSDTNGLQTNMVISSSGLVGIGTINPNGQLAVQAVVSGDDAIVAEGVYASGFGTDGIYSVGADTDFSSGSTGGDGGYFVGGAADTAADAGYGIYVQGGYYAPYSYGYAAYFDPGIDVNGTVVDNVSSSKIDHPLDPANKYLVHATVQSSEMMNIYTGNVITDELGLATVKLPDWFEAENTDFRYQLTVIGQFAQAIVKDKVANGQFRIMTNASHVEVSWQITAVRQDAYAKAHPLVVEQEKPARERGFYRNPELFGQPANKQTEWGRRPQQMQRMKEMRTKQALQIQQRKTAQSASPLSTPTPQQFATQPQTISQLSPK